MASNINPNNIDGAYPVAGQDNNSQGFRDNFTNTKINFQYAAEEITALQNNTILSANLANSAPVVNNLLGSTLSNGFLKNMFVTRAALGTLSGTVTIDYSAGSYQTVTTNGNISLSFTNFPAAGATATVSVQITVASTAHTVTLPAAVSVNNIGIQGLNPSTNVISFSSTGTYTFVFTTSDGGSTVIVNENNKRIQAFNNSSEDLTNSGGANLALTTTYFTTAGSETGTLSLGVEGQIKVFTAVDVTAGNMVITVTNAGWKSSGTGTITFNARGQSCILQYTNAKWYVIGSGPGAGNTFAQLA